MYVINLLKKIYPSLVFQLEMRKIPALVITVVIFKHIALRSKQTISVRKNELDKKI